MAPSQRPAKPIEVGDYQTVLSGSGASGCRPMPDGHTQELDNPIELFEPARERG